MAVMPRRLVGCWGKRAPTAILAATLFFALTAFPPAASTQIVPSDFADELVIDGLYAPTAFTRLPDGRILIAEKDGVVRVFKNGALLSTPFVDLRSRVNDYWDRGLLGIAADPAFTTNGYVYALYVYENDATDYSGTKTSRLTRLTASGDTAPLSSEVVILGTQVGSSCKNFPIGADCIPADAPNHSVGNIKFASDGTMLVTSGDAASFNFVDEDALRAQSLDSLAGKMLRITPTGQGLSSNPFWNGTATANRSKVWNYGVRNAFRFGLRPGTSMPYLGDVGWNSWEEVNVGRAGANFGWPCYEGADRQAGYGAFSTCQALYGLEPAGAQAPLAAYFHSEAGASVTGGTFYSGTAFPNEYRGAYFFGDYALNTLFYLHVDADDNLVGSVTEFATGLEGPVDIQTDGVNLLYLAINTGELRRIRYTRAPAPAGVSYLSDLGWTSSNGWGPVERDRSNGETGAADGTTIRLNGVTYAKGVGAHAPSEIRLALAGTCSTFQAAVGVDDEVGNGGSIVFEVWADGTKLYDSGVMRGTTATALVNVALTGRTELRLVITGGADGLANDHGDWADARVTCSTGTGADTDTTPPTVTAVTPTGGATGVAVGTTVTATFSEALQASTVTTATLTLAAQGSGTPVGASVTYDATARVATVDPTADLAASTTYTATVKGGASGVTDTAGNALAADYVWSFTTAAASTSTVRYVSDLPWTSATNGWGPVERDRSNGETGAADGATIRLNGVTYTKGAGAHAPSEIRLALGGTCSTFQAAVGVDDEVGSNGSIVFEVWGDATKLYDSGVMRGTTPTALVNVALTGRTELRLVITGGADGLSYDHGDWADARVTCSSGTGTDTTPPTVTAMTPTGGATGVAVGTTVTATFSEALQASTVTTATVTLVAQGSGTPVGASVAYDATARVATLDPTADLAASTTYTATVKGGASGVTDTAGNALAADYVWSFTTATAADTTPPTVTGVTPTSGATGAAVATTVSAIFSEPLQASTVTTATVTLVPQGSGTPIGASVTYDAAARVATLDPTADLAASTTYTVTVKGGARGVTDTAGNALAVDYVWSFTTGGSSNTRPVATITSPQSSFKFKVGDVVTYAGSATDTEDGSIPDMGLAWDIVIRHCPGGICHTHFLTSGTGKTGAFTVPDHGDDSYFVITLTATDSSNLTGTASVTINPQTVQITLQTAPSGMQVVYNGTSATAPATFTTVPGSTRTIYTPSPQGGASFVSWSDNGAQQHNVTAGTADVTYTATFADKTAPTVTAVTPTSGATGVAVATNVTATFSEALHPSTVTTATVTLVAQGSGTPVGASVTYDPAARVATLDPIAALAASTTYTATVKGGGSGVTDTAGNALAADYVWSFMTAAASTSTVRYVSDLPWTSATNGWGPVERDRSNGETGAADGATIRLNDVTYAKGVGAHAPSEIRLALGGTCSTFQAAVGVDDEVGNGGSIVFEVWADGTKLYDSGLMRGTTATALVNVALTGRTELRLVITGGADGLAYDHGDWADARVTCSSGTGTDTTPPTVTGVTPTSGATGVAVGTNVTATFSEALHASTVTTATVTLAAQGSGTPVGASVTYDATGRVATLDPAADLAASTTYTATVKGGASGVTDTAGNALAADYVWSFTTAAPGTSTVRYVSDLSWTSATNGWGPVERDRSNGETGATDGTTIRLNGVTYAKGVGAHAASEIRLALGGTCSTFQAAVGVDDEVGGNGSIVFEVWGDGTKLYDSGLMTGSTATAAVNVALTGRTELRLVITGGADGLSYDHGDWADARVTCSSGTGTDTTPPTVTAMTPASGATGVAVATTVTATFSEALHASTVTTAAVTAGGAGQRNGGRGERPPTTRCRG